MLKESEGCRSRTGKKNPDVNITPRLRSLTGVQLSKFCQWLVTLIIMSCPSYCICMHARHYLVVGT
jgi:hypothetical protein